ncbi:LOW QUALITY PROTEIN: EF-hand domain-containing family member C2 [Trematomus bernacchii]|uniref:LOW QUALITY PROTEIN: EF-hand domain-containing family member C2 n=1 Tax=Trematomus bernacchii TaxID=40690 RepID=UPI00146B1488|nr:LOW QUALITY PROTEIN: EF-hand domain-containing family member C2 [Trematomus bernacchii]
MALPFLPGNSRNRQLGKDRFHKSQHFDYSNGVPLLMGTEKPGIGGELLLGQEIKPKFSVYPKGEGSDLPAWVAFDKQALCFEAFCKEAETQAQDEKYRIRKFKIFFFLEDDTMQVVEPENKNSGIPHGTLIRRQRVPLPPPRDDQFYNIFHLNLNQQMVLYARTFTVTNCDSFTRNFLTKLGVILNNPATAPDDPHSRLLDKIEKSMTPLRPYERRDTLKQFLDHDREVLRFSCFWDDSESVFGDPHQLILHYYLSDDTVEILETITPNSGRDNPAKFLHRSKLPRHSAMMKQPGQMTDRTVLNVFDSNNQGKRYLLDSLKTGAVQDDYYVDSDLRVGGEVNVWGRRVIITDCDDFTKEHYRSKYGIEEFTPLQYKGPVAPKPPRLVPPYNGFGSEEDSLSSCQGLLPKPPQKDFRKFMDKDRCGLESNILNFRAKTVTSDPVDRERVFVISFYLSDDSISVFEHAQKNSGVLGGKFLERGRVKKPGQQLFKSQPSEYFTPQDLYVGATLVLNDKPFKLLDADEYTLNYMEKHAEEFPKANVGNILSKLRSIGEEKRSEIRKFLALSDPSKTGFIPYESFRGLMSGLDCVLSDHEVLVLARCFSQSEQQEADVGLMLAVAQDILRKKQFEDLPHMARNFLHCDWHKTGRLSSKEVRSICKASHLPLPESLLTALLSKFADGDQIDFHAFLTGIDWVENAAPRVMPDDILKFGLNVRSDAGGAAVKKVNYSSLLNQVFGFIVNNNADPTTTAAS